MRWILWWFEIWQVVRDERWQVTISSYHLFFFFFLFPHLSFHFHLKKERWIFKWNEIRLRWERDGRWWDLLYYFSSMRWWLVGWWFSSFSHLFINLTIISYIFSCIFYHLSLSLFINEVVDLLEMVGWSLWKTVKNMRW